MSDKQEAILARIRKLLAMARDSGASEGEVENALKFAKELMDKHDLAEAEVLSNPNTAPSVGETATSIKANEVANGVMHVCCAVCNTKFYIRSAEGILAIYGYPRDVAICKEMYQELFATVRAMVRASYGLGWSPRHRDYTRGFIAAMIEKAKKPSAGTAGAIVLVRDAKMDEWAQQKGLVRGRARKINIMDGGAYNRGHRDGSNVDLGRDNRFSNPVKRLGD